MQVDHSSVFVPIILYIHYYCFPASAIIAAVCQVTSVMSNSVRPHRQQPTRLPHPWDSPGKNTGVSCHSATWEALVGQ